MVCLELFFLIIILVNIIYNGSFDIKIVIFWIAFTFSKQDSGLGKKAGSVVLLTQITEQNKVKSSKISIFINIK